MGNSFDNLSTVKFQKKMKPYTLEIYNKIFPGCRVEDLREDGVNVHVLDQQFGIDSLIHLDGNQFISIQEKYRKHEFLKFGDFTQEYKNAHGTEHESDGEWFHLSAQYYFYGWANNTETGFEKWLLMDVAKYKKFVFEKGGLDKIGRLFKNQRHGKASFYGIPIKTLEPCFETDYRKYA